MGRLRKLMTEICLSLSSCATETVHETVRKWTELEGARGGYPAYLIRRNLYAQISCCLQRHLAQAVIDRRLELVCDRVL